MKETGLCFYDDEPMAYFSSNEQRLITRIMKLEQQSPGSIRIIKTPEKNGGILYCEIPKEWMLLRIPKKFNLSDEERKKRAELARELSRTN